MFAIALDVYLLEFLLLYINMSTMEATVMIYNVTQIEKNSQYFGVCDSKLFFLQIGPGISVLKILIQSRDCTAGNMDSKANIMIDQVFVLL